MGYKLPKKKKKGLTDDQKALRKEIKSIVQAEDKKKQKELQEQKDQMYQDIIEVVAPIALKEAVSFCIAIAQETNRDEFGHGKDRLKRFADRFLNKYDCICGGYVTIQDIINEMLKVTGKRHSFDFDEMVAEMVEAANEKRRARGEKC